MTRMLRELGISKPTGKHQLSANFLAPDKSLFLFLHIDVSKDPDGKDWDAFYIRMHLHHGAQDDVVDNEQTTQWVFDHLVALGRPEASALFFFDAEMLIPDAKPPPVMTPPITVGGRTLPVVGVSYGAGLEDGLVDKLAWTTDGAGIKLNVSYSGDRDFEKMPQLLFDERDRVEQYASEVIGR